MEPDRHARTTRRRATAFTVDHHTVGQRAVLLVGGDLDAIHAPELARAVHRALATRPEQLVVDVCHVGVVDYRGLAVLLNAHRRARRLGVKLSLACDVPSTRSLFERMRLDRYFDIHTTDGLSRAQDTRA